MGKIHYAILYSYIILSHFGLTVERCQKSIDTLVTFASTQTRLKMNPSEKSSAELTSLSCIENNIQSNGLACKELLEREYTVLLLIQD